MKLYYYDFKERRLIRVEKMRIVDANSLSDNPEDKPYDRIFVTPFGTKEEVEADYLFVLMGCGDYFFSLNEFIKGRLEIFVSIDKALEYVRRSEQEKDYFRR